MVQTYTSTPCGYRSIDEAHSNFFVIINWSSIADTNQCELTNRLSIDRLFSRSLVFIDCSGPDLLASKNAFLFGPVAEEILRAQK